MSLAGGADKPHVICGDFNSMPTSPVYQLTREGYLNDLSMAKLQALPTVQMADGKVIVFMIIFLFDDKPCFSLNWSHTDDSVSQFLLVLFHSVCVI